MISKLFSIVCRYRLYLIFNLFAIFIMLLETSAALFFATGDANKNLFFLSTIVTSAPSFLSTTKHCIYL